MPRTCKCGGRLVPTWYVVPHSTYATFRCDRCRITRKQKKRQPKKETQ